MRLRQPEPLRGLFLAVSQMLDKHGGSNLQHRRQLSLVRLDEPIGKSGKLFAAQTCAPPFVLECAPEPVKPLALAGWLAIR